MDSIKKICWSIARKLRSGNRATKWSYEFLRHIGIFDVYHWLQDISDSRKPTEQQKQFARIMDGLSAQVETVEQMLEDEMSKKVYRNVIAYRKTKSSNLLRGIVSKDQYFPQDIFNNVSAHEQFVDGGSYDGSDIIRFAKFTGDFEAVYAFEPLEDMASVINKKVDRKGLKNVRIYPVGLWKEKATLHFGLSGNASTVSAKGETSISADSLDNLFPNTNITWIKMDIEGAEVEALQGAKEIIKRNKPKLAICIYHKPEHLVEIPLLIKQLVPEYKLYIRHHTNRAIETVLYAKVD